VTHVDGSARVQTVDAAVNPRYHALLKAFERASGVPVLLNTSFNVRGEPIVRTAAEAYACFMRTGMELLVLEDHLFERGAQPPWPEGDAWRAALVPD
jgi:carbamoyltransferase